MAEENYIIPKPTELVFPDEELSVLAEIAQNEKYMVVLKRVARAYSDNMAKAAFRLKAEDPQMAIKHTRYFEQAVGMQLLVNLIKEAAQRLDKRGG